MLTQDIIDKFYEDVKGLGLKFPVAAIAEKTKYSKGNVSQYLNKKIPPSENFLDAFYKSFKIVPRGTGNVAKEPEVPYQKDYTMQSLQGLVESNKILAEAQKTLSDANYDLTGMLKAMIQSTVNAAPEIQQAGPSISGPLLEVLAELSVGKIYKSKQEALAALGMKLLPNTSKKKKEGIATGVGI